MSLKAAALEGAARRERDLAKLIALWPRKIEDRSVKGALHILAKLRRALRAELMPAIGLTTSTVISDC